MNPKIDVAAPDDKGEVDEDGEDEAGDDEVGEEVGGEAERQDPHHHHRHVHPRSQDGQDEVGEEEGGGDGADGVEGRDDEERPQGAEAEVRHHQVPPDVRRRLRIQGRLRQPILVRRLQTRQRPVSLPISVGSCGRPLTGA